MFADYYCSDPYSCTYATHLTATRSPSPTGKNKCDRLSSFIQANPINYRSFIQGLKITGLDDELANFKGTVFAFNNLAFERLTKRLGVSLTTIKKDKRLKAFLRDALRYHFFKGPVRPVVGFPNKRKGDWWADEY